MKKSINFMVAIFLTFLFIGCKEDKKEEIAKVKIKGEEVFYSTDSTKMKGYIAFNENMEGKRPGIIVVHEWWGHNDYVHKRADMLAELGYTALAIDMYGDGKQAHHPEDAGKFAMSVMSNMELATDRFNAALEILKKNPTVEPSKIAAIGYCFGGSLVLSMANLGADLNAVAAFHSGVELPVMPNSDLRANVLVCNGADDPFIPEASVEVFKSQMDSIQADYKYVSYKGAQHGFTNKDADSLGKKFNLPLAYQKEADEKSWEELKSLLQSVFSSY